jgi:DNA polymerase-3 subunit delta
MPSTKPIYALVGPDPFLQLQHVAEIMSVVGTGATRVDIDGERADLADVLDEVRSFSLFGSGKVVVVQSADAFLTKFREPLEAYVAKPSDSAVLVLRLSALPGTQRIAKAIAKTGVIIPCTPPKDLARWITDRAKSNHQIKVGPEVARLLADYVGDDLARLDSELAKLALTASGDEVKPQDVMSGVAYQREQELSEMVNAMAAGKVTEALRRWRRLLQTDSSAEFRAVTWLSMWLNNVRKALALRKSGTPAAAIPGAIRLWPREIHAPFLQTAWNVGDRGVRIGTDLLAVIDKQSKSGVGDAAYNVERFLLDMNRLISKPR